MLDYYKDYSGAYTMEMMNGSSRIELLKSLVEKHTTSGQSILDIGCGDMFLSTTSPDRNWEGLDIDISKAKAEAIQHDLNQKYRANQNQ